MPNIIKKIFIYVLAASMILPALIHVSFAKKDDVVLPYLDIPVTVNTVKVGVNSFNEAKLSNNYGSGYKLGYFDITRSFRSFAYISTNHISLRGDIGFALDENTYLGPIHLLLNYFYSDFNTAKSTADSVGGFPAYINGSYRVLIGAFADNASAEIAKGSIQYDSQLYTGSASSIVISETGTANYLFLYDNPGGHGLAISTDSGESPAETWLSGYYYCGAFEFSRNGNAVRAINYVDIESYVRGVLPYEMNGHWPIEALKSQAVCARTYVINNLNAYAKNGYDVRSDTYSQVYRGITESAESIVEAASSTANKYARFKGSICKVYYMSADGGATESGENTFGQRREYLTAVDDIYESDIKHDKQDWTVKFYPSDIQYKLNAKGFEMAQITDIIASKSDKGNVIGLRFVDINGKEAEIFNVDCYKVLGLNSLNYEVIKEASPENPQNVSFIFSGHGWGHNCGLSQWGSYAMAEHHKMSYNDIIDYYFSGAYIK